MRVRKSALAMAASIGAILGIVSNEGFSDKAYIPVPGDVPTIGYGSTKRDDGSPVQMGDTITEPEAREKAVREIRSVYEAGLKKCLTDIPLTQGEYDALVDAAYNLGTAAVCKSGMVRNFKTGNYKAGCEYFLKYRFSQGRDCFLPENAKICGGIKTRRIYEYRLCMGLVP